MSSCPTKDGQALLAVFFIFVNNAKTSGFPKVDESRTRDLTDVNQNQAVLGQWHRAANTYMFPVCRL